MNDPHRLGILLARPGRPDPDAAPLPGTQPLDLPGARPGSVLFIPAGLRPRRPLPLLLMLHGAGGLGEDMLAAIRRQAGQAGVAVLAPTSTGVSWDVIHGQYGPDVANIDQALRQAFAALPVDPGRIGIGGFSDGASYALSLGLTNGALFSDILAFSPGFQVSTRNEDAPRIFIAHGVADPVLPVDRCSRRLVPRLQQVGYDLDYHEFDGGHEIPPDMLEFAFLRFLARGV